MKREEIITLEVDIQRKIDVDVHVSDVMYSVNRLPLKKKWNLIAGIFTNLKLNGKDEDGESVDEEDILNAEQKEMIRIFLDKQLALI